MCGIAGFRLDAQADAAALAAMTATLAHRGPDGMGYFAEGGVGLGHRRLSILDLSTGSQPQTSEDGSVVVVFNGEIYNHLQLRAELEAKGHPSPPAPTPRCSCTCTSRRATPSPHA